ncbi:hypothetical protein DTO195F2_3144 [Paecilomyces variotii]|nr:hypothetical protein DTO195F2_3144 [Paecilomyces variotii]KAJ9373700.1 hypothetical protein DTO282E5_1484 [Paecilomyces variotii]
MAEKKREVSPESNFADPDFNPSNNTRKKARTAKRENPAPKKGRPRKTTKTKTKQKSKKTLQSEGRKARKDVKSKNQEIEKLADEVRVLRAALREKSTDEHAIDDKAIQNKFEDIITGAYSWTRNYSCDCPVSEEVVGHLKEYALLSNPEWLNCREEDLVEMARLPFGSNIFLNALLMRFLYESLIFNPFAAPSKSLIQRRAILEDNYTPPKFSMMLQQLAGQFRNSDSYGAAKWISHTLKMIYPSQAGSLDYERTLCSQKFYEDIAHGFFSSLDDCLIRKDIDVSKSKAELISLLKKADELRIDIWKQSFDIRPHLLGSIKLGEEFQPDSNIMQAHCSVPQDIAPGARLWMAVTPAVAAYWLNSVGEEQSKVWAKAVVWAGNPNEVEMVEDSDESLDEISIIDIDQDRLETKGESATDPKKNQPTATLPEVKMESIESSDSSTVPKTEEELVDEPVKLEPEDPIQVIVDLKA